jgi:hypothetical protein
MMDSFTFPGETLGLRDGSEAECGDLYDKKNQMMVTDGGEQPGKWEIVMCPLSSGSWNFICIRII